MGDHVFPILKFSYDNLPIDTMKACFLYLAIFPGDHEISLWILYSVGLEKGFWRECDNIDEAFNQGLDIIEHLKTACLFQSGNDYEMVKMHDVIRDMALWLATAYSGNNNKIVVEENDIAEACQVSKWKEAQKISLRTQRLEESTIPWNFPIY